jgi:hypothetical protein
MAGAQQYILKDMPKMVEQYGKDTAFFATNCGLQIPLIKAVAENGAMYPSPCDPSPYHGYPLALGVMSNDYDGGRLELDYVISESARMLKEHGVLGRFSNWPVPASMMFTHAAVEYAIKWLNGEVPKEGLDTAVLAQCMKDYAGVDAFLRDYDEGDGHFPNWQFVLLDYMIYGEEHIKGD